MTSRFGRLTYTSFDDGQGKGGWQVKQSLGLSPDEGTLLRSRITTQLDPGFQLSQFPSPDEIAAFPRRLVYAAAGPGVAFWHTAPAGSDASGRPGNVFAHTVLDRAPADGSAVRPIERWRSRDWLTPYGPESTAAATLPPEELPAPGEAVTSQRSIEFVLDYTHFRLGAFGALLDGVAAAIAGGRRIVFGTENVDTAALWLGAVSRLMPVQYAQHFFFSTLERTSGVPAAFEQGLHLVCVPRSDLDAFTPRDGYLLLDELEDIEIGDLNGHPHRTSRGYEIATTEWSAMTQVVLADPQSAAAALQQLDDVTRSMPNPGSEPACGLAMAVCLRLDLFPDAAAEAARVIARSAPSELGQYGELAEAATSLVNAQLGTTAADAWRELQALLAAPRRTAAMAQILFTVYLKRAVTDVAWLTRRGGAPMPDRVPVPENLVNEIASALIGVLDGIEAPGASGSERDRALTAGSVTGLVGRLRLGSAPLAERVANALDKHFVHQLFNADAPALIEHLGRFDETTQARLVRPLVENAPVLHQSALRRREQQRSPGHHSVDGDAPRPALPGSRIARRVMEWLFPEPVPPVPLVRDLSLDGLALRAELAAHLVRSDPPGRMFAAERPLALWATAAEWAAAGWEKADLVPFFIGPPWSAADLCLIEERHPRRIPLAYLSRTIKGSPPDGALRELCRMLLERDPMARYTRPPTGGGVTDLIQLRGLEGDRWYAYNRTAFDDVLALVLGGGSFATTVPGVDFHPVTVQHLRLACLLAGVLGRHQKETSEVRIAIAGLGPWRLDDNDRMAVETGLSSHVPLAQTALAAMVMEPKFPEPALQDGASAWLEQCIALDHLVPVPVLRAYVSRVLESHPYPNLKDDVVAVAGPRLAGRVENVERSQRAIERFAGNWARGLQNDARNRWKAERR